MQLLLSMTWKDQSSAVVISSTCNYVCLMLAYFSGYGLCCLEASVADSKPTAASDSALT